MRLLPTLACLLLSVPLIAHASDTDAARAAFTAVSVSHVQADLTVDFPHHRIDGVATLTLHWQSPKARVLKLGVRKLDIVSVAAIDDHGQSHKIRHKLDDDELMVDVRSHPSTVRIRYRTSPQSRSIRWMDANRSMHRSHPFMYTRGKPTAWIPLQTGQHAMAMTWSANVTVPAGMRAVMSASNDPAHAPGGAFTFTQRHPTTGNDWFLAIGRLDVHQLDAHHAVYATPTSLNKASRQTADIGRMTRFLSSHFGTPDSTRTDLLVIPGAALDGNQAFTDLVTLSQAFFDGDAGTLTWLPHEVGKSWLGHRVVPARPRDAWLVQAIHAYLRGRIVGALHGASTRNELLAMTTTRLSGYIDTLPRNTQRLEPKPKQLLTDGPFTQTSHVGHGKGEWFLYTLEHRYGRAAFDSFLKASFAHFAGKPVSTEQWLAYLKQHLVNAHPGRMDWNVIKQWVFYPGIVDNATTPPSPRLDHIRQQRKAFVAGDLPAARLDAADWNNLEWVQWLNALPHTPKLAHVQALDKAWQLGARSGSLLGSTWFAHAIRAGDKACWPAAATFMSRYPTRAWTYPIYEALSKTPDGRAFARKTFASIGTHYSRAYRHRLQQLLHGHKEAP